MASDEQCVVEHGILTLPDEAWEQARQRMEVIGSLLHDMHTSLDAMRPSYVGAGGSGNRPPRARRLSTVSGCLA